MSRECVAGTLRDNLTSCSPTYTDPDGRCMRLCWIVIWDVQIAKTDLNKKAHWTQPNVVY